jgi:hypothetical protein
MNFIIIMIMKKVIIMIKINLKKNAIIYSVMELMMLLINIIKVDMID